uniref:Uncharacterized protein n=1 Tax=Arundo donax TaxID=35708 RepID=A0A0A8YVZ2_ARUDO
MPRSNTYNPIDALKNATSDLQKLKTSNWMHQYQTDVKNIKAPKNKKMM